MATGSNYDFCLQYACTFAADQPTKKEVEAFGTNIKILDLDFDNQILFARQLYPGQMMSIGSTPFQQNGIGRQGHNNW